ncbi:hypothetical protein HDU86_006532 [Geranomyces michiganensis]|nr:hypothetical protein HDU86_006532 [Geranomyces michiganensis]
MRTSFAAAVVVALAAAAACPPTVRAQTCSGGPVASVAEFDTNKDYFADASSRVDTLSMYWNKIYDADAPRTAGPGLCGCCNADFHMRAAAETGLLETLRSVQSFGYAKNFNVEYKKYYKTVTIRSPKEQPRQYTMYLCNAPSTGSLAVPVTSLAIDSSDIYAAAFIERIGQLGTVSHVGPDTSLVASPCLLKRLAANQTVPYGNGTAIQGAASLVFASSELSGAPTTPFIPIAEAIRAESSPLARAEWVKFFSIFSNTESTANTLFKDTIARIYDCHATYGKGQSTKKTPKKVAWLAAASRLNAPSESFSSSDEPYTTALISAAGLSPLTLQPGSSLAQTTAVLKQTELFIEDTQVGTLTNYSWASLAPLYVSNPAELQQYPFTQSGIGALVFKPDRLRTANGTDYFVYNHWAQPDVVLNELMFSTTWSINSGKKLNLFRAIAATEEEASIGASDCVTSDPSESLHAIEGLSCPASSSGDNATPVGHDGGGGGSKTGGAIGATLAVLLIVAAGVLAWVFRHEILEKFHAMRFSRGDGGGEDRWTRAKARNGAIELT